MSKEPIGTITPIVWQHVLKVARDHDLNKGGYWDARSGCVILWAGPDNKPDGWPVEVDFSVGALNYPREVVASISPDFGTWDDSDTRRIAPLEWSDRTTEYPVEADVTCYAVSDWLKEHWPTGLGGWMVQHDRGDCQCETEGEHDRMERLAGFRRGRVPDDAEWVTLQWEALLAESRERVPPPLELEHVPDRFAGTCTRGHPLHRIVRVISSPYENGVGDWTHYCPECKSLCADEYTRRALMAKMMLQAGNGRDDGPIGHVIGWQP